MFGSGIQGAWEETGRPWYHSWVVFSKVKTMAWKSSSIARADEWKSQPFLSDTFPNPCQGSPLFRLIPDPKFPPFLSPFYNMSSPDILPVKSQALAAEERVMDILTAGCSQKLWPHGSWELATLRESEGCGHHQPLRGESETLPGGHKSAWEALRYWKGKRLL